MTFQNHPTIVEQADVHHVESLHFEHRPTGQLLADGTPETAPHLLIDLVLHPREYAEEITQFFFAAVTPWSLEVLPAEVLEVLLAEVEVKTEAESAENVPPSAEPAPPPAETAPAPAAETTSGPAAPTPDAPASEPGKASKSKVVPLTSPTEGGGETSGATKG